MAGDFDTWRDLAAQYRAWGKAAPPGVDRQDLYMLARAAIAASRRVLMANRMESAELMRQHAAKLREVASGRPDTSLVMTLRELATAHDDWAEELAQYEPETRPV